MIGPVSSRPGRPSPVLASAGAFVADPVIARSRGNRLLILPAGPGPASPGSRRRHGRVVAATAPPRPGRGRAWRVKARSGDETGVAPPEPVAARAIVAGPDAAWRVAPFARATPGTVAGPLARR